MEFSGSPKAGKSRAIGVLELFLKRNGIKAEAYTERASVAPIMSKGNLHFNTWVSAGSLQGLLESLYKDIHVFILDRGIFDGLVWNAWLQLTGKITPEEAQRFVDFFTWERWTALVDIVFVMTCDPKKSIEREYADQLTTKRGTIMQEDTLQQINNCIRAIMDKHKHIFKKVLHLDTTNLSTRTGVAKITDQVLRGSNELLDEAVGVVPRTALKVSLPASGFVSEPGLVSSFINATYRNRVFLPRSQAERSPDHLQPIPCAVVRFQDSLLFLKRKEPGHPLHDAYAIWVGGHVKEADAHDADMLIKALTRELDEEIFIRGGYRLEPRPVGLVRSSENERAARHIGIVYQITLSTEDVGLGLNQKEFRETRGRSMSGRLVPISKIGELYEDMGDWSQSIVKELWPEQGDLFRAR